MRHFKGEYGQQKRKRMRKGWIVYGLACVVALCTVSALTLPAITLESSGCAIPEHSHTQECYTHVTSTEKRVPVCNGQTLSIHQHTQECYGTEGNLQCGQADSVAHKHDTLCYDEEGNLWCTLPEVEAHMHGDSCYAAAEAGHTHTETCYTRVRSELICTEHVHTDDCYTEKSILVCTEEHGHGENCNTESSILACTEEHEHGETCYTENPIPVCTEEHGHNENCYKVQRVLSCGVESDHQHTDSCYTWQETLICGLSTEPVSEPTLICSIPQMPAHQHSDDCFAPGEPEPLTCTLPEDENHTHTVLCYGTWELTCGMEEHTHTPECSADPTADVETAQQWEQTFADVRLTGEWPVDVLAIAKTQLGYEESEKNYVLKEDGTHAGYTRYGAWYGSPYGDWCAMFVSFCIHYADVEEMPLNAGCIPWIQELAKVELYHAAHTEEAYIPVPGDLVFFDWQGDGASDHVGLVMEIRPATDEEPAKLISIEGNSSNRVQCVTYDLDASEILGFGQLPKQTFYCGKTGHAHIDECGGEGACLLEEHIHTEQCELPVEEEEETEQTELVFEGPDYTVTVRYEADAGLPEGVGLEVSEIPADSEEYQDYLQQANTAMEAAGQSDTVVFARFFDIRFLLEGETLEPAAPVSVTITYTEPVDTAEDANCQAIHFAEAGTEILDVTTEQKEDGSTSFTHTQNGFSVVGDVVTVSLVTNSADVGPNRLPVDYYVCIDGTWTCVGSTKNGWYYTWDGTEGWTNYNRDYITVEHALSILGPYGFTGNEKNPSLVTAYQQKSGGNFKVYSDTDTVDISGQMVLPLSRNADHAGYNLYYLPNNTVQITGVASPENLDKTANGFYTVKVYNAEGVLLTSKIVKTGGSFTYDATESNVTDWLVAYGSGSTETISGSTISLSNITTPVIVSPNSEGDTGSHSVTFKVMIDGQWKTVGSLPYYYSGTVNGSQRAYITSAMAAQMFGDYGYTANTDPGYHFGYSYNDIYTLFYANGSTKTNFCMDISGGTLAEAQVVQLYTSNGTDAQVFRIWDAGNGYSFITPIGNSGYHVNVYGYVSGDPSSTQLKLSTATDKNSQWKVDTGSDGRTTFWSAIAPEDQVIDLHNNQKVNGGRLQVWHSTGGARYWYMVQQYRISNDTASEQNTDGTWNIGLTPESNGDIVCYYLPGETTAAYTNTAESGIDAKNSFWPVSVRDDTHSVYSEGELSTMVQYAPNEGEVTVTVRNADGILWSCRGVNGGALDVESTQSEGDTTFTIKNITGPVEVVATKADPTFTVQYYANIPRFADSGDTSLNVIDTSGKVLPTNGGSMATRSLYLEGIGRNTSQNAGTATELYEVMTTAELTKLYTEKQGCQYESEPGLEYFNKLKDNENYELKEIWVLKEGKSADSTNPEDWAVYTYNAETAFTNEAGKAGENTILITDSAVIRLVFNTSSGDYHNGTTFYDYDISNGKSTDGTWITSQAGINSAGNYSGTGAKFAFGNQNCGVTLKDEAFDGNTLNKANSTNSNYGKSTFNLVTGLDENGYIKYNSAVTAPKLFNEGDAIGKHTYSGSSLTFDRVGDTYTLCAATLKKTDGGSHTINELQYFFHPSPVAGRIWDGVNSGLKWQSNIFTNNFWPMDVAVERTDGLWGKYGEEIYYNSTEKAFPDGDDGNAHNWFFGMNFSLSFTLTEDYLGPLEYIFFGDDDMWVFLDNQLVCDIGGVHSSIGEYVNLRDYLPEGSSGQHTLSFFYTERGASGSTCWMSFTLPSVSSATTSRDTGSLQIAKSLEETGDADFSKEEYKFQVELLTGENGTPLNQTFSYSRSGGTYGTIKSGGIITLHQNEIATISGIPAGTFYRVTELTTEGYHTTVNGNEGYIVSGTMTAGRVEPASFVNRPYTELPNTGGAGTVPYTMGGCLLTAGALLLLLYSHRRRRKEDAPSF